MKKFNAVNKRNGRKFIVSFEEGQKPVTFDVEKEVEKEVSEATIKRWFEIGEEVEVPKKEKTEKKQAKPTGNGDKRKKLTEQQVLEIYEKHGNGQSKASLAREYGMSYSGMHWVINGNTWAYLKKAN